MKTLMLCFAATALCPAAASARTPMPAGEQKVVVDYADLNLHSAVDQHRLQARMSFAAYRLCLVDAPASPSPTIADPACVRETMAQELEQVRAAIARSHRDQLSVASSDR